ncbi:class I adenylate-forming enzyme family protein [Streptomyces sp. NBC_00893]|uniref:class I adenylate-forming enzyme family protein n=1 Tax=Streptomyces sp. NBC_00893 TaxID=2975862 RepID=UPI00225BB63F|nr:fatty acid--CoA ligase family protein [Streptomyces sp. NBC_00893]MCX4844626.1 fatty acid--CoA ligase family protein [Streptomyces sp. NBC_00893]
MSEPRSSGENEARKSFFASLREFAKNAEKTAIVFHDRPHTYAGLIDEMALWQRRFDESEVTAGAVVALEGGYSLNSCAALLALIDRGAVLVPLGPLPDHKREEFLAVAEVETVVRAEGDGTGHIEHTGAHASHELFGRLRAASRPGLVLFSSGTTGSSKASVLDFAKVLSRYSIATNPRRILSFLSLDHIGGINTLLHTFSQGGTVVAVPERTPDAVFAAIAEHGVQILPTTPTFLNMALMSGAIERHDCTALTLVTYGTEPMPIQTLRRLTTALPGAHFKQTYGLSELGILPTRSKSDDTLWLKLGGAGFDYKIVDDVLWVRSDMAMLGYLNASAPFDEEGYFNTQDVVQVDGEYLRILGRRSEIINVGGEKVYPNEVEGVLLEADNVADVTVSGLPSPVTGMVVKATVRLITAEDGKAVAIRVRKLCREQLEAYKVPVVVEVSEAPQHSERFKKSRSV